MIIELNELSYRYPRTRTDALSGVSATVTPGIYLLLGENGAGKTTLLHLIDGLLFPSSGKCMIDSTPTRLRLPSITSHVFFLGDDTEFPYNTLRDMVRVHACFYPRFSAEMLEENLKAFGLKDTDNLSGMSLGMRRKAMVAYALALRAEVTLLDEPANGLDIESKLALQQIIARNVEPEQTVIVSTHNIADLRALFDGVMVLNHGQLQLSASTDAILNRVAFLSLREPHPQALHSELRMGTWHCIVPNADGELDTDIDYQLLYTALHSPDSETLTSILHSDENR